MGYLLKVFLSLLVLQCSTLDAAPPDKRYSLPSICYNQDGVLVPMRGSCSGFFICVDGHAVASSCGDYYHFNARTGYCDHPERAACFHYESLHGEETADGVDDDDVQPPLYTVSTQAATPSIPLQPWTPPLLPTQRPSQPLPLPKPKDPAEVVSDESAGAICQHQPTGTLLPKADSCSQYFVCIVQRPYRRSCPPMLHFNATRKLCQDPALAQCPLSLQLQHVPSSRLEQAPVNGAMNDAIADADADAHADAAAAKLTYHYGAHEDIDFDILCSTSTDGRLLQHPKSCDRFIYCKHRRALVLMCPRGLEFSRSHQHCERPSLAQCQVPKRQQL